MVLVATVKPNEYYQHSLQELIGLFVAGFTVHSRIVGEQMPSYTIALHTRYLIHIDGEEMLYFIYVEQSIIRIPSNNF